MKRKHAAIWKRRLDLVLTSLMLVVSCLALWAFFTGPRRPPQASELPEGPIALGSLLSIGQSESDTTVVLFSDFQCPFCASFATADMESFLSQIQVGELAELQFAHFPLESIHPAARSSAEAVECARRQEAGWSLHDALFARSAAQQLRTKDDVVAAVLSLGEPLASQAMNCLTAGQGAGHIKMQQEVATLLGVRSTPTFVIGKKRPDGFYPIKRILGAQDPSGLVEEIRRVSATVIR